MGILITGGTGFIGAELARLLVTEDGARPVLFDLYPNREAVVDLDDAVTIVEGDFSEPADLTAAIEAHDIDGIFHLGYFTSAAEKYPSQASRINVLGTTRLFELALAKGVRRVVWPSSAAVYGTATTAPDPVWHTESDPPAPNSIYGACKLFNEHVAEVLAERHGFDHVALRLCSVFGPARAYRRGISPDFYASILEAPRSGEPVEAPPADHVLTWGYVKDAARAFKLAFDADAPPSRIYNFVGASTTVKEAVDLATSLVPEARITYGNAPLRHLAYLDGGKIEAELGFTPEFTMDAAMQDYLETTSR